MFLLLVALCLSKEPITGGWQTISSNSAELKHVKGYLDRNLHHLFPEMKEKSYSIKSAMIQIVNGMNVKLVLKTKSIHLFEIVLYADHNQKIDITSITPLPGNRPTVGGFNWVNAASFTNDNLDHLIDLIQKKVNLLIKKPGEAIVYRKQVINGIRTHVIFRDANKNLFSAVTVKSGNTEELDHVFQIY